jgi:hypothetical protein
MIEMYDAVERSLDHLYDYDPEETDHLLVQDIAAERQAKHGIVIDPDRNVEENLRTLREDAWIGPRIAGFYEHAVNVDPDIAAGKIIAGPDPNLLPAAVIPPWLSKSGETLVLLPLGSKGREAMDTLRTRHVRDVEIIAGKLGLDYADVDTESLACFFGMHELKHVSRYLGRTCTSGAFRERMQEDDYLVDIANWAPFIDENPLVQSAVTDNWGQLQERFGVQTVDELIDLGSAAHRLLPEEAEADEFAAAILAGIRY